MLAFSKEQAKGYGKYQQIAFDKTTGQQFFVVKSQPAPAQKHSNPMDIVSMEFLHKLKKQYGVSKKVVSSIRNSYKQRSSHIHLPDESLSTQLFVKNIENHILDTLRTTYINQHGDIELWYPPPDTHRALGTIVMGSTGSGKTVKVLNEIVMQENMIDRPIVIFSPFSRNDPAILSMIKARPKSKKLVRRIDLKAVEQNQVKLNPMDIPENSIVILDDIESLPRQRSKEKYSLRHEIFGLAANLFLAGRHRGICPVFLAHSLFSNGPEFALIKREAAILFILWRNGSRSQYSKFMTQVIGIPKKKVERFYKNAGVGSGSRWIGLSLTTPQFVCSKKHVELLE